MIPEWQRRQGVDQYGPHLAEQDCLPIRLCDLPYLHPDNPKPTGESLMAGPFRVTVTDRDHQIIQVVPTQWYDTFLVTVRDLAGMAATGNQMFGRYGVIRSDPGVNVFPTGGLIPVATPDFLLAPFNQIGSLFHEVPFGSVPFWMNLSGSVGTSFEAVVWLLRRRQ